MKEKCVLKKSCSFYISDMHFVTMLIPFIKEQIENETHIITFLENDYTQNIELVLARTSLEEEKKKKILNLSWTKTDIADVGPIIENNKINIKPEIIIINGSKEYIEIVNNIINEYLKENEKECEDINVFIMDFFDAEEIKDEMKEILNEHNIIFNTSGEHKVEEIYNNKENKINAN